MIRNFYRITSYKLNMSKSATRGTLIVFEGGDKCGKTTHTQKLVEALSSQGKKALLIKFPDRTTQTGQLIDEYLTKKENPAMEDHAIHLLFAANRWESVPKMLQHLQEGTTLIVDRYSFSGVAYSAAKPEMNMHWCRQPEIGLPKPDAVLYLSAPTQVAAGRGTYGCERYENVEMQTKVAKNYENLITSEWIRINTDKDIEEVHAEIMTAVSNVMKQIKSNEVEKLWINECEVSEKH